jgi:hypothetical protein
MKIRYHAGAGELIWVMTTCRPNIAYTSVKLSQSNSNLAENHYHRLKHAIQYLYTMRHKGIYFWRTQPRPDLPNGPLPIINSNAWDLLLNNRPDHKALIAVAYGNSNWATCFKTCHSFSGICIHLTGGTIAYKTKFQPTIAHSSSSTKAEFIAACNFVRMSFFVRSILWDLDIPQEAATIVYEDNNGCTAMYNAQKPTTCTQNIDIKYFALWIGLNATSSTWNGSTPPSTMLITLPNLSSGSFFIGTPTSYLAMYLRNTHRHTNTQSPHTGIVSKMTLTISCPIHS